MITAHIPSLPDREESLRRVIAAISPQVDRVYVSLNGYDRIPEWLSNLRYANCELLDNSLGDGAKWLHVNDESSVCVLLDDDLVVGMNFVWYLMYGLNRYGGALSLHGRTYTKPVGSFRRNYTGNYRCLGNVANDVKVQLIGTGCTIFDNRQVKLDNSVYEHKNMADVLFSRFCTYNNIPMTVLKHRAGEYLRYIKPANTIWSTSGDCSIQTEILNSFLK